MQVKYLGSENARGLWGKEQLPLLLYREKKSKFYSNLIFYVGIKHTRRPVDHLVRIQ